MSTQPSLDRFNRIVVKVGSSLLVDRTKGALKQEWLDALVADLAALHRRGADILVVSSGAIALGRTASGFAKGALKLEDSQAAAAIGQIALARAWAHAFAAYDITAAQVLLTLQDTEERRRYLNARATLARLAAMRAIPVINENDTVATSEIRYGDNDRLAARVATMASADLLILLSDVAGLYDAPPGDNPKAKLVPIVARITPRYRSDGRRRRFRAFARRHAHQDRGGAHRDIGGHAYGDRRRAHRASDRGDWRGRALHLVPDAIEPDRGAENLDRRLAGAERRRPCRRRRRQGAGLGQKPAAGRRDANRRRLRARRLRRHPRRARAPKSDAG